MRAAERRVAIERELAVSGRVDVALLARQLGVSQVSIRRDLNELVERGLARRVYGGALAVTPPEERPFVVRRPGPAASAKSTIGLLVPSSHYYYAGVLGGLKEAAVEARVRVVLAVSGYDPNEERAQLKRLQEHGVAGFIVTPAVIPQRDRRTYELLTELTKPTVLMERDGGDEFSMLDVVRSDHEQGARLAFRQLAQDGHRAVALVAVGGTATAGWLRAGFESERGRFDGGRAMHLDLPSAPDYAPEMRAAIDAALDGFDEAGVTAAVVHTDIAAAGLAQRARERGLEVNIVAYDDEVAALADPPLDAVAPPKHEVGRLALRLVLERVRERNSAVVVPRHIVLPPALILRAPAS